MFDDDPTPAGVSRAVWRWFPAWANALLAAMILGGILTFALWRAHVWFAPREANLQTQVQHNGIGYQGGQVTVLEQQIANVESVTTEMGTANGSMLSNMHAQRLGDANLACQAAAQVNAIPAADQPWVTANCTAGSVSPSSPLNS